MTDIDLAIIGGWVLGVITAICIDRSVGIITAWIYGGKR